MPAGCGANLGVFTDIAEEEDFVDAFCHGALRCFPELNFGDHLDAIGCDLDRFGLDTIAIVCQRRVDGMCCRGCTSIVDGCVASAQYATKIIL